MNTKRLKAVRRLIQYCAARKGVGTVDDLARGVRYTILYSYTHQSSTLFFDF